MPARWLAGADKLCMALDKAVYCSHKLEEGRAKVTARTRKSGKRICGVNRCAGSA